MIETQKGSSATRRADAAREINDVAAAYARAALDALHAEDIRGHVPSIRTALAAAEAVGSLRDHLLLKKLGIFLFAISSIPAEERRTMVRKLHDDASFGENLGEHLIELLDRVDGRRKSAMVGAVFTAYAFGQIDAKMLRRLNASIERLPITEVEALRTLQGTGDRVKPDRIALQALSSAGLAETSIASQQLVYQLNEVGRLFLELELDRIRPSEG